MITPFPSLLFACYPVTAVSQVRAQRQGSKFTSHSGLTLIEVLVVLAIISILSALALKVVDRQPAYFERLAKADLMNFQLAILAKTASTNNRDCQSGCFEGTLVNHRRKPLSDFYSPTSPSSTSSSGDIHYYLFAARRFSASRKDAGAPDCDIVGDWRWVTIAIPADNNGDDTSNAMYYYDTGAGFTDADGNSDCICNIDCVGNELW